MEQLKLKDETIKLGQALKAAGIVQSGEEAKYIIQDGIVKVNGKIENQRGKKLVKGDCIEYNGETLSIC